MSENTMFLITEQPNELFTVTRHWVEANLPKMNGYSRTNFTLKQTTAYCDSEQAEYGYRIVWRSDERYSLPIELLYNERYEGDDAEAGPFFTIATVRVHPSEGRLTLDVPESGQIYLTQKGWETLVQQVNQRFEEAPE